VRVGIEAGNEHMRNHVYKKNISNEQCTEVIHLLHKHGIRITGYNMLGGPGETRETLQDTFKFVKDLEIDRPIFFTYRPLPKTRGAELVSGVGGRILDWGGIDSLHSRSNITTPFLKPADILIFRYKCLFYFTLKRTLKLVRKQKARFFVNLFRYLFRGIRDGVGFEYAIGYFYVCAGDNLLDETSKQMVVLKSPPDQERSGLCPICRYGEVQSELPDLQFQSFPQRGYRFGVT
jgi:hypothetical protein